MRATFSGFTTAQMALSSSQNALHVTGQNIANINTEGYTRQQADQISLNTTTPDQRFNIGYGSMTTKISQIRDPYLDIRFRSEVASLGEADLVCSVLSELENVFDEVAKSGLQDQLSEVLTTLQDYSLNPNNQAFQEMVKGSADSLTKLINQYAKEVTTVRTETSDSLLEVDIPNVNLLLEKIGALNYSIEQAELLGSSPLELYDERNMYLDELASYIPIEVKTIETTLQPGITVGRVQVNLVQDGVDSYGNSNDILIVNGYISGSFEGSIDEFGETDIQYTSAIGETRVETAVSELNTLIENLESANYNIAIYNLKIQAETDDASISSLNVEKSSWEAVRDGVLKQIDAMFAINYATDERGVVTELSFIEEKASEAQYDDNGDFDGYSSATSTLYTIPLTDISNITTAQAMPTASQPFSVDETGVIYVQTLNALYPLSSNATTLQLDFESGSFAGSLQMLNEYGDGITFKGIGFYEEQLNTFALMLAEVFNGINNAGVEPSPYSTDYTADNYDPDYDPNTDVPYNLFTFSNPPNDDWFFGQQVLEDNPLYDYTIDPNYEEYDEEGNLVETFNEGMAIQYLVNEGIINDSHYAGITAPAMDFSTITFNDLAGYTIDDYEYIVPAEIWVDAEPPSNFASMLQVSTGWNNDEWGIVNSVTGGASGANDNILNMINALNTSHTFESYAPEYLDSFSSPDDPQIAEGDLIRSFEGSFHEFFANTSSVLGLDINNNEQVLNNHTVLVNDIENSRSSVSGVNLDEEGMNLIKYQQAYNAAARLMTTLDEALDKIINSMGLVGR